MCLCKVGLFVSFAIVQMCEVCSGKIDENERNEYSVTCLWLNLNFVLSRVVFSISVLRKLSF